MCDITDGQNRTLWGYYYACKQVQCTTYVHKGRVTQWVGQICSRWYFLNGHTYWCPLYVRAVRPNGHRYVRTCTNMNAHFQVTDKCDNSLWQKVSMQLLKCIIHVYKNARFHSRCNFNNKMTANVEPGLLWQSNSEVLCEVVYYLQTTWVV